MNFLFLAIAALLEAGGDAIVRRGREAGQGGSRLAFFVAGALVLFAYGFVVNRPGWSFGRSLGIYVFLFFVVAQVLSWVVFHEPPGRGAYAGTVAFAIGAGLIYFVK
jgi:drug/metabolite transporter superfamily protein YnfA